MTAQAPPRLAAIAAISLAGAAAIHGAVWLHAASVMRDQIEKWTEDRRAEGISLAYSRLSAAGYPFRLRTVFRDVSIGDGARWTWRGERLYVDAFLFERGVMVFSAPDPHALEIAGAGEFVIASRDGRARFEPGARGRWRIEARSGPGAIENARFGAAIAADSFRLEFGPSRDEPDALALAARAEGVSLRRDAGAVGAETLTLALVLRGAGRLAESPNAWRAIGGHVGFESALVATGGEARIGGAIGLDDDGRPAGYADAEIANPALFAAMLRDIGAIGPERADILAAQLTLAAITSGGRLAAPVVFEEGIATLAGATLAELPQLAPAFRPDQP